MLSKVNTSAVNGLSAMPVFLEVNCQQLHAQDATSLYFMVGLPDNAVRESKLRVENALLSSGVKLSDRMKFTINFAPADVRKEGSGYDLPLALGLMASVGQVPAEKLSRYVLVGELGLDGSIRPIKGALSIAIKAREQQYEGLIVPRDNVREAAVVNKLKVYGADHLQQVIDFFKGEDSLQPTLVNTREEFYAAQSQFPFDFADVKGQQSVKRAFEVAAAGGHNIMLIGADGAESDTLKLNYSVKGLFGRQVLYTARQNGTVLTLDVPASVATFRCTMEDLTTMMNNGINTLVFKTEKTSTTLNLSLLTEGYDADAKVKLHQCGSTVRLSVNGRGRRDLLIGR